MRVFTCQVCGQRTYFGNIRCERCGSTLGFVPDDLRLHALRPAGPDGGEPERWVAVGGGLPGPLRRCGNWIDYDVCNWMVDADDPERLCHACRLNDVIPDLSQPGNLERWSRLEAAKRRLVFNLRTLGLPVVPRSAEPGRGLAFRFLADPGLPGEGPATTGHAEGIVTINVGEADDAVREQRRVDLREPYRTLVGHLRHESGHYYWERLINSDPAVLGRFRERFGDERADYQEALQRHYDEGPPPDWPEQFVSAYATMHPWEDWAETWAHYLHIRATLETAEAVGVHGSEDLAGRSFDDVVACWTRLAPALNELNRSMGLPDLYPFVLPPPAVEKLRFVHDVVSA